MPAARCSSADVAGDRRHHRTPDGPSPCEAWAGPANPSSPTPSLATTGSESGSIDGIFWVSVGRRTPGPRPRRWPCRPTWLPARRAARMSATVQTGQAAPPQAPGGEGLPDCPRRRLGDPRRPADGRRRAAIVVPNPHHHPRRQPRHRPRRRRSIPSAAPGRGPGVALLSGEVVRQTSVGGDADALDGRPGMRLLAAGPGHLRGHGPRRRSLGGHRRRA